MSVYSLVSALTQDQIFKKSDDSLKQHVYCLSIVSRFLSDHHLGRGHPNYMAQIHLILVIIYELSCKLTVHLDLHQLHYVVYVFTSSGMTATHISSSFIPLLLIHFNKERFSLSTSRLACDQRGVTLLCCILCSRTQLAISSLMNWDPLSVVRLIGNPCVRTLFV